MHTPTSPCTQQKQDGCYDNSILLFQLHVLLVVRRLLFKIGMYACTYDVYASFICDSIVIIIDVHPTHISLTHGFQGNKHIMDVIIMTHAYSMCRMPSLPSQINEACDEQLLLATKYCYGRKENMQLR